MTRPSSTRLGRDIRAYLPARGDVDGYLALDGDDLAVWERALPLLGVRNNDRHTIYAYGMARALLDTEPDADAAVARTAILLHDIGWSTVPEHEVLEAIAPGGGRHELVRQHEVEGARLAREILESLGRPAPLIDRVVEIIDGHDTRLTHLSVEDAIVKDADKLWRITPDGLDVVQGWFDLDADEALRIVCARVHPALFTDSARAMARGLAAIASIDLAPQRRGL